MRRIGYSMIGDAAGGKEFGWSPSLPWSPPPPDNPLGRVATFTAVDQVADGYRIVERWQTEPIHAHQVSAGQSIAFDGSKIVVNMQWTDKPVADVISARIAEIKAIAQGRILALVGTDDLMPGLIKQMNASMRAGQLNDKQINGGLTAAEQAEADALRSLAASISAIRAHSNDLEAEVAVLSSVAAVIAWTDKGWPA